MKQATLNELADILQKWEKAEGILINTYSITELGPRVIYTDLKNRKHPVKSTRQRFHELTDDIIDVLKPANVDYIEIVKSPGKIAFFYKKVGRQEPQAIWLRDNAATADAI